MVKACLYCRKAKELSEFYADRSRPDGRSNGCKPCVLVRRAAFREGHREQLRVQAKADRRRVPERGCWQAMIARCYSEKNEKFHDYGARGIRVCARWRASFDAFLHDMGPRPSPQHTIDREDVNGNYEPSNCRWATPKQQGRNTRRNRVLEAFGKSQCLSAWAEELGIPRHTISDRIDRFGWSVEEALSTPRLSRGQRSGRAA